MQTNKTIALSQAGDGLACPLCDRPVPPPRGSAADTCQFNCPACATFIISREAKDLVLRHQSQHRYLLSWYSRALAIRNRIAFFTSKSGISPPGLAQCITPVSIDEVIRDFSPKSIGDRFDRALVNLSLLSADLGERLMLPWDSDWSLLCSKNAGEMRFVLRALEDLGLIRTESYSSGNDAWLTALGWQRAAELSSGYVPAKQRQGFVAMWFGNPNHDFQGRPSREFCNDAYEHGFAAGIIDAGYAPRRIDQKEFIGDIKDEILAEIRISRFVVADFTGQRAGVYFEAGFAMGLGIPVFYACHSADIEKSHFDTNHFNHLVWSSSEELAKNLKNRISAHLE